MDALRDARAKPRVSVWLGNCRRSWDFALHSPDGKKAHQGGRICLHFYSGDEGFLWSFDAQGRLELEIWRSAVRGEFMRSQ